MKLRMFWILIGMIGVTFCGLADQPRSPKSLGAAWANVSDRATVQLMLDDLQSGLMRRDRSLPAELMQRLSAIQQQLTRETPQLMIRDNQALFEFRDGSQVILRQEDRRWQVADVRLTQRQTAAASNDGQNGSIMLSGQRGFSAGETFETVALDRENHISQLSRTVTRTQIDRKLFGAPGKTASYYSAIYHNDARGVEASYVQFVTDPAWNRLVYGSMNRWLKVYEDLKGPSALAVDASGRVFVGETGRERIAVFQLTGSDDEAELQYRFEIPDIDNPNDIALSDNGTPLDVSDDFLYVADASQNTVFKFALAANSAHQVAAWDVFEAPIALATGKFNGVSNEMIYVIDKIGKRLRQFRDDGASLWQLNVLNGGPELYFSSLRSDHFGQLYLVDQVNSRLLKYSGNLVYLDRQGDRQMFKRLANVDIPFGKIQVAGQPTIWTGFNQLFTIESWTDNSGMQRRKLNTAIREAIFDSDENFSIIRSRFLLTDVGNLTVNILDEADNLVRRIDAGWMNAGRKATLWDRRDARGEQVLSGNYRYEIAAASAYTDDETVLSAGFYLPLYLWQNGGSAIEADNRFLHQGRAIQWGDSPSQTAVADPTAVVYQFSGLDPAADYQIDLEFLAGDGLERRQRVMAGAENILDNIVVDDQAGRSGYITLPKASYADGRLRISIFNDGDGDALVSQLWLKETGAALQVQQLNKGETNPRGFTLQQNYPNPFNPETVIGYSLSVDRSVTLTIFDILGRKVKTLVNKQQQPGNHSVRWDGKNEAGQNVSSGIYFYKLSVGEFSVSKQMLLMK